MSLKEIVEEIRVKDVGVKLFVRNSLIFLGNYSFFQDNLVMASKIVR